MENTINLQEISLSEMECINGGIAPLLIAAGKLALSAGAAGVVSGFAYNVVSGFAYNVVSGFAYNVVSDWLNG